MPPKVSICITTYNRVSYLNRLLDSIAEQTFRDFDIWITDNSETTVVKDFVASYQQKLPINYHKNVPAVGMTENWNTCMAMAAGEWIKLIHDDDWFNGPDALAGFMSMTDKGSRFIFCARQDYNEDTREYKEVKISKERFDEVARYPLLLFADNYLGQPSGLMFHSSVKEYYDPRLKWYVDIEYYLSFLKKESAVYMNAPLINVSYNDSQMTNYCINNPQVVVPEFFYVLKKHKIVNTDNIVVYDAWWRLFRNVGVRGVAEVYKFCPDARIPDQVKAIIEDQQQINAGLLKKGVVSKALMTLSYIRNKNKGKR